MTQPAALEAGRAYVVQGRTLGLLVHVFEREVRSGRRGLIVSRIRPSTLGERYDIAGATALWLTDIPGAERVSIADLEPLHQSIGLAQDDNGTVVLALDGIEYLASHIGSDATVKVLESLKDNVPDQGQGAAQAIEDAVILGQCLDGAEDVPAALRAYEARRWTRTARVARASRRYGAVMHWENRIACRIRNAIMSRVPERIAERRIEQLLRFP